MTLPEWGNEYLGGYVKMSIESRKEAVKELAEEGLSQRQIAGVIGVGQSTIKRDMRESNDSPQEEPQEEVPDIEEDVEDEP